MKDIKIVDVVENDRNQIVENLRIFGICYLVSDKIKQETRDRLPVQVLIKRIAESSDPRLRLALIALFIRHPRKSTVVPGVVELLDEPACTELKTSYMAAVCLQRFLIPRLKLYMKDYSSPTGPVFQGTFPS